MFGISHSGFVLCTWGGSCANISFYWGLFFFSLNLFHKVSFLVSFFFLLFSHLLFSVRDIFGSGLRRSRTVFHCLFCLYQLPFLRLILLFTGVWI
ncbi:hypothetical protein BO85DRAFT_117547 [Aspergillus piperis CBS 112811]|uniref:Uncharacterized protein n=1 Tax=Aspergillus piperis CBS 112811 TaxID=1448313 RepID=A0A8G1VTH4_9EURO|nr:hypothetical protein BO85DRAFT_117547 [Aspergillus piperis CBS 112811]RAH61808.1 hypothetical protein BO85DRAFT_117547 [Aspergillus piperis CBS 112811]